MPTYNTYNIYTPYTRNYRTKIACGAVWDMKCFNKSFGKIVQNWEL